MNRWQLDGARAVVTGGTRGIGLAVVLELLELGASVVTVGRDLDDLDPRLEAARDAGRLHLTAADLATAEGRAALIALIPATWDAVEILVNNVGTNIRTPSLDATDEDYRRILDTNLTTAWDLSRALHPRLAASGRGAIVNVGSVAGQVSVGTGAVYAMTKAAIEHLTRYLAVEWARDGIRVNAVAPWYIRTPLVEPILGDPATLERVLAVTPMRRVGEPHEAAAVIVFLCLPAASYVTGQVVAADGGFLAYGFSPRP
jgi:Tropinone reductase 1